MCEKFRSLEEEYIWMHHNLPPKVDFLFHSMRIRCRPMTAATWLVQHKYISPTHTAHTNDDLLKSCHAFNLTLSVGAQRWRWHIQASIYILCTITERCTQHTHTQLLLAHIRFKNVIVFAWSRNSNRKIWMFLFTNCSVILHDGVRATAANNDI